ncbi:MAG: DUF998 domain-containing protein [Humibacillus sp.]|nr:DUF998 domain-containing protein [Humibacillus sp.]MDN5779309.1 DUF998 domain-containing protein [Humibacillus sp.]
MSLGRHRVAVVGAFCWLVQPLYIVAELLVAAGASATYSLRDSTISDLGSIGCSPSLCSPWHPAMNTAFVVFSLLRVAGALLLFRSWPPGRWAVTATVLWVVSGVFSAAIGFVPVDQHPSLHVLVAVPVFVTQPLAVIATALAFTGTHPALTASGVMVGLGGLVGAAGFLAVSSGPHWVGFWERVALWPAYPWLAVVGAVVLTSGRSSRSRLEPAAGR